jgi:hypothetical protein
MDGLLNLILRVRSLLEVAPTIIVLIAYGTVSALFGGWMLRKTDAD